MQRRVAALIATIHIRTARNQHCHQLLVGASTRQVDRRQAVLILGVHIAIATLEQLGHDGQVALLGGTMQQVCASVTARVGRRNFAAHNGRQPCDQTVGGRLVVCNQRIKAVNGLLVVDGEECILAVSPDLIVIDVGQMAHRQHKVAVGRIALADQKVTVFDVICNQI